MTNQLRDNAIKMRCPYCGAGLAEVVKNTLLTTFFSHPVRCRDCAKPLYLNTELIISVTTEPTLPVMPILN